MNGKHQKLFINIEYICSIESSFCQGYSDIHLFNGAWLPCVIGDAEELTKTVENYFEEMERTNDYCKRSKKTCEVSE